MRPSLEGKPLVVLSNNDGCAIARTQEAKDLGIKMGAPWFKIRHLADSHGLVALSANFSLYGDLSQRMMNVIGQFSPRQEIYSIDESFLDLTGIEGSGRELGSAIRQRVRQWVGIPTCVGIGPTKTLAKLANHLAKKVPRLQGVCDLARLDQPARLKAMRHVPIEDVWGVGRRLAPALQAMGIYTAADLAKQNPSQIQAQFSVVLAKTVKELDGQACVQWEDAPPAKQQIMCSRSFGRPVTELADLKQALAVFTERAAHKLRLQQCVTQAIQVFIRTSPFRDGPKYTGSTVIQVRPTQSSSEMIQAVTRALAKIYRPHYLYAKAGVCLLDICAQSSLQAQPGLFDTLDDSGALGAREALMGVMDHINTRYGRSTLVSAQALSNEVAPWQMRQERMTPAYTTDWNQVVEIWR